MVIPLAFPNIPFYAQAVFFRCFKKRLPLPDIFSQFLGLHLKSDFSVDQIVYHLLENLCPVGINRMGLVIPKNEIRFSNVFFIIIKPNLAWIFISYFSWFGQIGQSVKHR